MPKMKLFRVTIFIWYPISKVSGFPYSNVLKPLEKTPIKRQN